MAARRASPKEACQDGGGRCGEESESKQTERMGNRGDQEHRKGWKHATRKLEDAKHSFGFGNGNLQYAVGHEYPCASGDRGFRHRVQQGEAAQSAGGCRGMCFYERGRSGEATSDGHQHFQHHREHEEVHQRGAGGDEQRAAGQEEVDESSFTGKQPRADEEPALPEQPGEAQDQCTDDADLDLHQEELRWTEDLQLPGESIGLLHLQQGEDEPLQQGVSHQEEQESERNGSDEPDQQPTPQFFEMVTEGHAVVVGMVWHLQHG